MELNDDFNNFEEDNNFDDDYSGYDDPGETDWKKESYYALTDGAYGTYDNFIENGGDLDYLMDFLGF